MTVLPEKALALLLKIGFQSSTGGIPTDYSEEQRLLLVLGLTRAQPVPYIFGTSISFSVITDTGLDYLAEHWDESDD